MSLKLNVPVGFDKDDIINPYDQYLSGYHSSDLQSNFHLDDIVAHWIDLQTSFSVLYRIQLRISKQIG